MKIMFALQKERAMRRIIWLFILSLLVFPATPLFLKIIRDEGGRYILLEKNNLVRLGEPVVIYEKSKNNVSWDSPVIKGKVSKIENYIYMRVNWRSPYTVNGAPYVITGVEEHFVAVIFVKDKERQKSIMEKEAIKALEKGEIEKSIDYYKQILKLDPYDEEAKSRLEELEDYRKTSLTLNGFLAFKREHPKSPFLDVFRKRLLAKYPNLPPEKYWKRSLERNSQGFWEAKFNNDHKMVWIPSLRLWVDKYEVSNKQYEIYCQKTGIPLVSLLPVKDYISKCPNYPAFVSFAQAKQYCNFWGMRLLTEKEWREVWGPKKYPWGEASPDEGGIYRANYEAFEDGFEGPSPVKSFEKYASPYGIVNLAGNAWEWVEGKIAKGGGFLSFKESLDKDATIEPTIDDPIGFRCAKEVSDDEKK